MFDNGNVNWCMLGRAFLCRTGHFCVEPGFFVSNHAFCCRTGLFVSNECYNIGQLLRALVCFRQTAHSVMLTTACMRHVHSAENEFR